MSESAAGYTPHVLDDAAVPHALALTVAQGGQTMYVGGRFRTVANSSRTATYQRSNLMAFDASTGAVSPFAPTLNGNVWAVLAVGDSVYVGGEFSTVNGVSRPAVAKIDATTGAVDRAFQPPIAGGRVSEIRLVNGRLLVGGTFRRSLLALSPTTGANTGYIDAGISGRLEGSSGKTEVHKFAVDPAGTRLVAVGNFTSVSGQARSRAFMLDLGASSSSLDPWYYQPLDRRCISTKPSLIASLEDVDFSPDGSYFVFAATGYVPQKSDYIGTDVCDAAARFETKIAHPQTPTWINYTGGDTLHSVAVTGAAVYVQGHSRWLDNPYGKDFKGPGAVDRLGIGAIDPASGKALPWNPSKPAAQGGQDFLATAAGLWVVSDSKRFHGAFHQGIAFTPLP